MAPLTRRDCEAGNDEVNCSQSEETADLGIEFQLLNSLEQEPNHRLLFAIEACGHLQIFEVGFYERSHCTHTHVKMIQHCTTPGQAFILLGQGKSLPQKHSKMPFTQQAYFSERRNISLGDADCFLRTQLKHSHVVK